MDPGVRNWNVKVSDPTNASTLLLYKNSPPTNRGEYDTTGRAAQPQGMVAATGERASADTSGATRVMLIEYHPSREELTKSICDPTTSCIMIPTPLVTAVITPVGVSITTPPTVVKVGVRVKLELRKDTVTLY